VENILDSNIKSEFFRNIILEENELELFQNIPKVKLNILKQYESIRNHNFCLSYFMNNRNVELNQRINKIMEYYHLEKIIFKKYL